MIVTVKEMSITQWVSLHVYPHRVWKELLFIYVTLLVYSLLVVGSLLAIGLSAYIVKHFGATYMYIHIS